jgi:hypothetical protein
LIALKTVAFTDDPPGCPESYIDNAVDGFRRDEIDEEFTERPLRRARAAGVAGAATTVASARNPAVPPRSI